MDLQKTDYIASPWVFVKKNGAFSCYHAEVEYWIQESWYSYVGAKEGHIDALYFQFIQQFKVDLDELKKAYALLVEGERTKQNVLALYGNLPSVYIDFDKRLFINHFYDQVLEKRVIEGWTGRYENFLDNIPLEFRYWIVDGEDIVAKLSTKDSNIT